MRRSRLYLCLSILSLGVAGFFAAVDSRCQRGFECSVANPADHHREQMYVGLVDRNPDTIMRHAGELMAHDRIDGYRMYGYAWRMKGEHQLAADAYSECLASDRTHKDVPLIIDAFIGRAAAYAALGRLDLAKTDIDHAASVSHARLDDRPDDPWAHYQLACVYAVRSTIVTRGYDRDRALEYLQLAIVNGFDAFEHMRADIDLASLHGSKQFEKLLPSA